MQRKRPKKKKQGRENLKKKEENVFIRNKKETLKK